MELHEIAFWEGEKPRYLQTLNASAAISSGADQLQQAPLLALGQGGRIGVWDAGSVRHTHQEFGGRVTLVDAVTNHSHSTHVAGTLAASGVVANARGMAPLALIDSYDWLDDLSELLDAGATYSGEPGKIYVSNHSYGYTAGWSQNTKSNPQWFWNGTGVTSSAYEPYFGCYSAETRACDAVAAATPWLAMFWAAGNDRSANPPAGANVFISTEFSSVPYNPASHPPGDGVYRGGYDTISYNALAKNVITVGAVNDAVQGGKRHLAAATMTSFSSWGPADDGRIKPDLVANGISLYSTTSESDASYGNSSGTSMAAPNAAGTAQQLQSLHAALFEGRYLRAATLKGLLIHTADDLGTPGPDYQFGWGLVNGLAAGRLLCHAATNPTLPTLIESCLTTTTPRSYYRFYATTNSAIKVTLSWCDPPGTASESHDARTPALVNDLNLRLLAPNGAIYQPYVMPFVGDWSQASMAYPATTGSNRVDNVEQVVIATPPRNGHYRVVVSHAGTLTEGEQAYGLLISGSTAPPAATLFLVK